MKKVFKTILFLGSILINVLVGIASFGVFEDLTARSTLFAFFVSLSLLLIYLLLSKFYLAHWLFRRIFYFNKITGRYDCTLKYEAHDYVINGEKGKNKEKRFGSKKVKLEIKHYENELVTKLVTNKTSLGGKLIAWKEKVGTITLLFGYENPGSNDEIAKKLRPHRGYMELIIKDDKIMSGNYLTHKPSAGTLSFK